MITFTIAIVSLVIGYVIYGKFIDRVVDFDYSNPTPAIAHPDGVDFLQLPTWKVYMIQFLNIAGLGQIFGAIMGAKFGTASYLWIVFGTIFAGAVHDFVAAMMSLAHDGESLPEIIGRYLGLTTKKVFLVFTVVLMILVGVVFVSGPAELLAKMTADWGTGAIFWIVVIFLYTFLPRFSRSIRSLAVCIRTSHSRSSSWPWAFSSRSMSIVPTSPRCVRASAPSMSPTPSSR